MEYLTVGQAATLLNCSLYHITVLAEKEHLVAHRLHQRGWTRIQKVSLEQYATRLGIDIDYNKLPEHGRKKQLAGSS